ncbi:hypothetical protein [Saccharibacillus kuerlensis]|uniref:CBS domain-containing protein n=1 Tax=Saccharibacillus kuerlensis TaxID=459527 RepID=A0ABQ2L7L3_9BACL|nr:hypothetical protein [Saccharibacillus kuerlensis]GGO06124.1 hypothetical protein GCM10010969_33200 [Saccharibacillus kuerlensis]
MTFIKETTIRPFGVNSSEDHGKMMEGIGMLAAPAPVLSDTATCGETLRLLSERQQEACIVICDAKQRSVGLVMSDAFYIQMNAEYEAEHLYELPVSRLMSLYPLTVDFETSVRVVREWSEARPARTRQEAIIVTREGRFFGVVQPTDL